MFTAALFIIVNIQNQSKCPITDKWIKQMWYIYIMEYYSAIKRNKILIHTKTWMNLETLIKKNRHKRWDTIIPFKSSE